MKTVDPNHPETESSSCRTTWSSERSNRQRKKEALRCPQHDLHGFSKCAHSLCTQLSALKGSTWEAWRTCSSHREADGRRAAADRRPTTGGGARQDGPARGGPQRRNEHQRALRARLSAGLRFQEDERPGSLQPGQGSEEASAQTQPKTPLRGDGDAGERHLW